MKLFTKERALTPSWDLLQPSMELVRKYIWHIVYLSFAPALLVSVGLVLLGEKNVDLSSSSATSAAGLIILAGAGLWSFLVFPGFTYFQVKATQGEEPGIMESFKKGLPHIGSIIGAAILTALIFIVGLLLFIVPGLIALRALILVPYFIVDQNLGPAEAIKKSFRETQPVTAWVWGIIGVQFVFALAGSILGYLPVVGYLLSILVSYPYIFAPAMRYNEIANKKKVTPRP